MNKIIFIIPVIIISAMFVPYLFFSFIAWIFSDPFDLIDFGQIDPMHTQEEKCRIQVRSMFDDLVDTWGVNTNNQDTISKSMIEIYDRCVQEKK